MPDFPEIVTERLRLRAWRPSDRAPFARLNADPEVVRYLPWVLTTEQSDRLADRIEADCARRGFGLWAVEIPGVAPFAGFIGLAVPTFDAHFTPCVEIGWRLATEVWGKGYATEGARAVLAFAFDQLKLDEVVSITVPDNWASRRVMEKIGMQRDLDGDFDHPVLAEESPLRRHVLYRSGATPSETA